jgi:hypothetical protein
VNANSTCQLKVETGDTAVAAHVGLHALGRFADRLDLGRTLSAAIPWTGERAPLHDRGKVLVQMALVLAGGGETCSDIEHLRFQDDLFGHTPSDSTVYRTFRQIDGKVLARIDKAIATVRRGVWQRLTPSIGDNPVILDIDSTLVEVHSENKDGTGPTYKGGFGFHPIACFADATGEALSGKLRPGNAGANCAADHVEVTDAALAQLPDEVRAGHRPGDDPALVRHEIVMRTDSAGSSKAFVAALSERNIKFMTAAASTPEVHEAIFDAEGDWEVWLPARTEDGEGRDRSHVCELTSLVSLSGWPEGTRLIVRREPLHPGAQRSLFPSFEYRYWGFYTNCEGDPVSLDQKMRAHAHVEKHIERLKQSGLERFPFTDFQANTAWMRIVMLAADLVRWFQLLCLEGYWRQARPKALRWALWHTPGRLVRSGRRRIVRLIDGWPTETQLLGAYRRIAALT